MPRFETGYWDIRGLAAPIRMMCAYANADVEDKQYPLAVKEGGGYDASAWFGVKPTYKEKNSYINLPYVVDNESGLTITQSTSCYTYLGRKLNLMGSNEAELTAVEQTLAQCFDLRNDVIDLVYPFKAVKTAEDYAAALPTHLDGNAKTHYEKFEGFFGDKPFLAAATITAGDFHVWEMLDQHEMMASRAGLPSLLESFPKLKAFYQRVRALPELEKYFSSGAYGFPVNNKMAHFK